MAAGYRRVSMDTVTRKRGWLVPGPLAMYTVTRKRGWLVPGPLATNCGSLFFETRVHLQDLSIVSGTV